MDGPLIVKLLSFLQHVLYNFLFPFSITFAKSFEWFLIKVSYVTVLFMHVWTASDFSALLDLS